MSRIKKWMIAIVMLVMVCSLQFGKNLPVLRADSATAVNSQGDGQPSSADKPRAEAVEQDVAQISNELPEFSDWNQAKVKPLYTAVDLSGQTSLVMYEVLTPQPGYLVIRPGGASLSLMEFGHTLPSKWLNVNVEHGDQLYYLGASGLFCKHAASPDEAVDLLTGERLPFKSLKSALSSSHSSRSKGQMPSGSAFRFALVKTPDLPPDSGLGILVTAASGSVRPYQVVTGGGWVVQNLSSTGYQTAHAVKGVVTVDNGKIDPKLAFLKLQNVFLPDERPFYASSDMEFSWVLAQADSM